MVIQPFLCAVNWGVVGWVLVGTIALLVVVAAVGRAIAAAFPPNPEHVSSFRKPVAPASVPATPVAAAPGAPAVAPAATSAAGTIPPEIMAVIAASVAVALRGKRFAITGVEPSQKPADIERLMSLWSLEGRRQVYSSHSLPR